MNKELVKPSISIYGCGDVGTRLLKKLLEVQPLDDIVTIVRSEESKKTLLAISSNVIRADFDSHVTLQERVLSSEQIYYFVPPQKFGAEDLRTKQLILALEKHKTQNQRIVLISTTGVYGDCHGELVTEETPINPTTDRSKRRSSLETQWQDYASKSKSTLSILRVPGIYSHSRLPRKRIESGIPVVDPKECGLTNRIHADDLAMICQQVMQQQTSSDIYNVSDGNPGNISQYLLDVAEYLDLPKPPIVSMKEGEKVITTGMMSYLKESRSIDNTKLLKTFGIQLRYTNYLEGIQF